MAIIPYAELHAHTDFSFLDGASTADDLVERAVAQGLTGLAVTDHNGLYGAVRFMGAAEEAGLHGIVGTEIELLDPAVPDPGAIVIPPRRRPRRRRAEPPVDEQLATEGRPARPRPQRAKLPGHRDPVKEDLRGIGTRARGPHLVLLARTPIGWRSLSRLISRANLAGTKSVPRFRHDLLEEEHEGVIALSGCRDGEIARRLRVGDRAGARAAAERYASIFGRGDGPSSSGFFIELSHHLLPDDDWLVTESVALAEELGLPVVVTNDVHYATADDREFHDVLTAIKHGRTVDALADLRRPDAESFLKSGEQLAALEAGFDAATARAWREGITASVEVAASCSVDLGFEQYRFPGFAVPVGETPFSYLSELCWAGAKRRYHPLTSAVVNRLAHELDVIERAGLAEFFLICWDLMRFAREQGIPAQGRGSATSSIVSYTLGISRVEPIAHSLLFERFINPGRTTYPDVDIDFSSARREEVIQYIYRRYGTEHTGMVCNLVTYRARSAVREVGYALGFPRPLVDRVAKALETYDSVMVRRDLEADGGFAEFFRRTGDDLSGEERAASEAEAHGLVDRMGQLNTRIPLVGKVPPWKQPPAPPDPDAPRPFAWLREGEEASAAPGAESGTGATGSGTSATNVHGPASSLRSGDAAPLVRADRATGSGASAPFPRPILAPPEDLALGRSQAVSDSTTHAQDAPLGPPSGPRSPDSSGGGRIPPGNGDPRAFREDPLAPVTTVRHGPSDDEGGPGDTPASVAWLRAGRGTGYPGQRPGDIVEVDPESGMQLPPPRKTDRLGRPSMWDPPPTPTNTNSVARI